MYMALAVFAAVIGLLVTFLASITAYLYYKERRSDMLLRWTALDYAVLLLFAIGTSFLIVELIAVSKDRDSYPFYHYGYLLSGIIYSVLGMLYVTVRHMLLLRAAAGALPSGGTGAAVQQHHQPEQRQAAE